jgi:hypothetical protein
MEISWTADERYEEVLHRAKEERNILHRIKRRKSNWNGHILHRNCLPNPVIEAKIGGSSLCETKTYAATGLP